MDVLIVISLCLDNMIGNYLDGYCLNCCIGKFCVYGKYVVVKIEMLIGERIEFLW